MPHSQEDLNRLAQYGNSQQDSRAAHTNTGAALSGLSDGVKAHLETQARYNRLDAEARARRMAAIPVDVRRQVDSEIADDLSRYFLKFVLAPIALFIGIIWIGELSKPDYSHIDKYAIYKIEPDPALHAPRNERVKELSRLSIEEILRSSSGAGRLKRGQTPSQEQLDFGQAIWLSHIANPNAYQQVDEFKRDFAYNLVAGYLTHRAIESGDDRFFIELGNDGVRLNPYGSSSAIWKKLAHNHPDVPVLHAMADGGLEIEFRFFRGLYFILSFVGLDDRVRNFVG